SGEAGEVLRDVAGDAGRVFAGIERGRIGPDRAQAFAQLGTTQVLQVDAVRLRIGKTHVGAAGAGEFAEELDDVADVAHDEERRTSLGRRQVTDVAARLVVGAFEGAVPLPGTAHTVAGLVGGRLLVDQAELI